MYKQKGRNDRNISARAAGVDDGRASKKTHRTSRTNARSAFQGGKTWKGSDGRKNNGAVRNGSRGFADQKQGGMHSRRDMIDAQSVNSAYGHASKFKKRATTSRSVTDDRRGYADRNNLPKRTYTVKETRRTEVSEYSRIIGDIQDERTDRRSSGGARRKKNEGSHVAQATSRFSRGKSSQRSNSGNRSKRKRSIFDHTVFIKEATAQHQDAKQYVVKNHFTDFDFHTRLKKNIEARGYVDPTPIQDQAIPYALKGRDVIGIANTGTGKTAAFLLPLIHKICNDPQQCVLILAPTRELALQIDDECRQFTKDMNIQTLVCIGGTSMQKQLRSVRKNAQIIIGTPGRTKDLLQRKVLQLGRVNNIVLDEMDRMLDMGFINDITLLLSKAAPRRQSLFFSATMDANIAKLVMNYLHEPVTVEIASRPTSENVHQDVIFVQDGEDKLEKLHGVLQKKECEKVLVFSRTKMGAKRLAQKLHQRGMRADSIHGDMSQGQRQRTLASFRTDRLHILVATDVVARGIDIDGISHVINYDLPESYEDYIHRIGRTGRGSSIGHALTFFEK